MIRMSSRDATRYGLHSRGATREKGSAKEISPSSEANHTPQLPLTLILPFPPTTNNLYTTVGRKRVRSSAAETYHKAVSAVVFELGVTNTRLKGRFAVRIDLTMPDNRRRDIANYEKCLCDALTGAGLWDDDSQIDELHIHRAGVGRGLARVTIDRLGS